MGLKGGEKLPVMSLVVMSGEESEVTSTTILSGPPPFDVTWDSDMCTSVMMGDTFVGAANSALLLLLFWVCGCEEFKFCEAWVCWLWIEEGSNKFRNRFASFASRFGQEYKGFTELNEKKKKIVL